MEPNSEMREELSRLCQEIREFATVLYRAIAEEKSTDELRGLFVFYREVEERAEGPAREAFTQLLDTLEKVIAERNEGVS